MEKSFNDQELSDIMKEIEALEEDFKGEKAKEEPVIGQLAEMDQKVSVPLKSEVVEFEKKAPKSSEVSSINSGHSPASMSFKVQGDLNLELKFEIGGKVVSLDVSEKGLQIEMDGGMTFSIPLDKTNKKKSA